MVKKLVAYFSATGQTARAARTLAQAAGADLFEIRPVTPYTAADLNWNDKSSRSTLEMNDPSSRPEIAELPASLAEYDVIFVGFPIWWYTAPHIILTFLEANRMNGKTLVAFATSGGSPMGHTDDDLRKACPEAMWLTGKLVSPSVSEADCCAWLASLHV